ncbi:MAG: hypothetical protein MK538_15585 [Planctomycetes bacterium]|nr:hypothetical protein [Planctomycetota bacterium]
MMKKLSSLNMARVNSTVAKDKLKRQRTMAVGDTGHEFPGAVLSAVV